MPDIWAFLNANSGSVVAVATVASVVITLLLLAEARTTRNLRREAAVAAYPRAHPPMSMLLELVVANFGPANARDVMIEFHFTGEGGNKGEAVRKQIEPIMPVGRSRRFLASPGEQLDDLNQLAARGLTLHVDWSWNDDRRRLWFLPLRHSRSASFHAEDLRAGFYGGWALTERDGSEDLHTIADKLVYIEKHLKGLEGDTKVLLRRRHAEGDVQIALPDVRPEAVRGWLRTLLFSRRRN